MWFVIDTTYCGAFYVFANLPIIKQTDRATLVLCEMEQTFLNNETIEKYSTCRKKCLTKGLELKNEKHDFGMIHK